MFSFEKNYTKKKKISKIAKKMKNVFGFVKENIGVKSILFYSSILKSKYR